MEGLLASLAVFALGVVFGAFGVVIAAVFGVVARIGLF